MLAVRITKQVLLRSGRWNFILLTGLRPLCQQQLALYRDLFAARI